MTTNKCDQGAGQLSALTTRYVIARGSQFLIDLYRSQAVWSVACQDCLSTGHAYLDESAAISKLKDAQAALGDSTLTLASVTLKRVGTDWLPVNQQGLEHDFLPRLH